ncbi:10165_t:CDS:2, partial [Ambispora leptoticha]
EIDIQQLVSTRDFLHEALHEAESKLEIAGTIQAFEKSLIMAELLMSNQDKKIIIKILSKYPYQFYAYGSRVKGTARKFSDLDVCYQEEIPSYKVVEIEEELENSDLPFIVELVN